MLKPRYGTLKEAVGDFYTLMDGMSVVDARGPRAISETPEHQAHLSLVDKANKLIADVLDYAQANGIDPHSLVHTLPHHHRQEMYQRHAGALDGLEDVIKHAQEIQDRTMFGSPEHQEWHVRQHHAYKLKEPHERAISRYGRDRKEDRPNEEPKQTDDEMGQSAQAIMRGQQAQPTAQESAEWKYMRKLAGLDEDNDCLPWDTGSASNNKFASDLLTEAAVDIGALKAKLARLKKPEGFKQPAGEPPRPANIPPPHGYPAKGLGLADQPREQPKPEPKEPEPEKARRRIIVSPPSSPAKPEPKPTPRPEPKIRLKPKRPEPEQEPAGEPLPKKLKPKGPGLPAPDFKSREGRLSAIRASQARVGLPKGPPLNSPKREMDIHKSRSLHPDVHVALGSHDRLMSKHRAAHGLLPDYVPPAPASAGDSPRNRFRRFSTIKHGGEVRQVKMNQMAVEREQVASDLERAADHAPTALQQRMLNIAHAHRVHAGSYRKGIMPKLESLLKMGAALIEECRRFGNRLVRR